MVGEHRSRTWLTPPLERRSHRRDARGPALRFSCLLSRNQACGCAALPVSPFPRVVRIQGDRRGMLQRKSRSTVDSTNTQASTGHLTSGCSGLVFAHRRACTLSPTYTSRDGYIIPSSQNGHRLTGGSASGPPSIVCPHEEQRKSHCVVARSSIVSPHPAHRSVFGSFDSIDVRQELHP
jgi:hypothetical protein